MNMKIRICEKFKNKIKNQSGMTLVELIVVFALMGIFMVAATFMLSTSMQLFSRMQATSQAVTVSDLILDKISGEIAAADIPQKGKEGYYFWLESDAGSPWVAFCNRSGSPVSIYADNDSAKGFGQGQLFMKHYKMSEEDKKQLNEINWHFDKQVYMNYQISDLKFSRPEPSAHPNVIKIDLTLTNEKTGFAYSTVRYAENYNFDFNTNYMCVRNDGGSGLPKEAEEFKIDGIIDTDPTVIDYTVYYRDVTNMDGPDLLQPKVGQVEEGTSVLEPIPSIPGYTYNAEKSENPKIIDALNHTIYLYYDKVQVGDFTVYCVNKNTNEELDRSVYSNKKIGEKLYINAPYIAGYHMPSPNYVEVTYTEENNTYTFRYPPKLQNYVIYYRTRDGWGDLKEPSRGTMYTDESITVNAPLILGYTPESPSYTFTFPREDIDEKPYFIYYTKNFEHPYNTVGPNIDVAISPGQVPQELQELAKNIADFFNSEWKQVGQTGYYKEYTDGDEIGIVGGWGGESGNETSWIEAIENQEGEGSVENSLFIMANGSTNSTEREEFLEYIISISNLGSYEDTLDDINNIKFEFEGTHLKTLTFSIKDTKQDVTITFY